MYVGFPAEAMYMYVCHPYIFELAGFRSCSLSAEALFFFLFSSLWKTARGKRRQEGCVNNDHTWRTMVPWIQNISYASYFRIVRTRWLPHENIMHTKKIKQVRESATDSGCMKMSCKWKVGGPSIQKISVLEIFWIHSTLIIFLSWVKRFTWRNIVAAFHVETSYFE